MAKTETKTKPECPKCGSTQVLYSKRKKKSSCRVCGHEGPKFPIIKRVMAG